MNFGITNIDPTTVQEGGSIIFIVSFFEESLVLDDDFVVEFSVKLLYGDTGGNATSKQQLQCFSNFLIICKTCLIGLAILCVR